MQDNHSNESTEALESAYKKVVGVKSLIICLEYYAQDKGLDIRQAGDLLCRALNDAADDLARAYHILSETPKE